MERELKSEDQDSYKLDLDQFTEIENKLSLLISDSFTDELMENQLQVNTIN